MVQKILAYERSADFGPWRRQVNLLAGTGGFGPLADGAIEAAARRVIAAGIPPAYATRITYGNWRSPYCPDPCRFRQSTVESLSEGSLCWVYVGHAGHRSLAGLEVPGGLYAGLDIADLEQLRGRHAAPIACLLACHTGAFDAPEDCLAEGMLAAPGGPVAVICGSQVTMPYSMAVLGTELLAEIFERRPATIGRAAVGRQAANGGAGERSELRSALDALAALFNPEAAEEELAEHLNLFNLLGRPAADAQNARAARRALPAARAGRRPARDRSGDTRGGPGDRGAGSAAQRAGISAPAAGRLYGARAAIRRICRERIAARTTRAWRLRTGCGAGAQTDYAAGSGPGAGHVRSARVHRGQPSVGRRFR